MSGALNHRQIWRMPLILAFVSIVGLLAALLGNNWWDVLSWGTLGYTMAVMLWYVLKPTL
ncbi:MAG: hypothetical protein NPIRA02_31530 [Nitrospirales bacterium]|nr:MAG: hypothetical protein NPIRA02_31530 [Nitrospirales bacterium]